MKIKTGDKVRVLAGKDKGKEGTIIQVFPKLERVVVEGVNMLTKHLKKQGERAGQKIEFPAPIHASNLQVISSKTGKSGRVGYKFIDKEGKKTKIRLIRSKGQSEDIE
ncbi:50S ribosomal protein L24 [Candidatus Uhrbacteria bacterium CG10_big_fil_rev_8_21_14_0_10_48_16]|uniref:Large ribosomal subunit protein uL24 n=1 Tax=Candidatus Uhrbacteria bacterium CG10_big_fil_rev_8_21_14_0_10_48_16 TaxID=1975038 RepID=A0A2M8LGU5_9BACT|nr:MAG: 50S ribosomal protein L24 [Candidatus Uhrbacteria bacterium CG10_big_fil_rev_8_21_14_0_10_48_16]